jgi:hypothetical protein
MILTMMRINTYQMKHMKINKLIYHIGGMIGFYLCLIYLLILSQQQIKTIYSDPIDTHIHDTIGVGSPQDRINREGYMNDPITTIHSVGTTQPIGNMNDPIWVATYGQDKVIYKTINEPGTTRLDLDTESKEPGSTRLDQDQNDIANRLGEVLTEIERFYVLKAVRLIEARNQDYVNGLVGSSSIQITE